MAASRARISDVFAGGLHLHDIRSADPARNSQASLSEITDGTSNTIAVAEETGREGPVRPGDAPIQSISDGTSNTILVGEEAGREDFRSRPGDARRSRTSATAPPTRSS